MLKELWCTLFSFIGEKRRTELKKKRSEIPNIPPPVPLSCCNILELWSLSVNCSWAKASALKWVLYIFQSNFTAPFNFIISDFLSPWINPEFISLGKRECFPSQKASCMEHFSILRDFDSTLLRRDLQSKIHYNCLQNRKANVSQLIWFNERTAQVSLVHLFPSTSLLYLPPTRFPGWDLIRRNIHKSISHREMCHLFTRFATVDLWKPT